MVEWGGHHGGWGGFGPPSYIVKKCPGVSSDSDDRLRSRGISPSIISEFHKQPLRKTQHSSNHKHSSLHKILHPQPNRLAPSEKYSLQQTYHINFPFQNKYKTPVFIHFADAIQKFQKITRQMLCDKCSKYDVTLIPQNVDVLWREKYAAPQNQKITRQMLCDKCSKNDVTLIPQNVDVL